MTVRTSTTRAHKESKKRTGAVKEINETDLNDMAFKLVTIMFVFFGIKNTLNLFSLFLPFFVRSGQGIAASATSVPHWRCVPPLISASDVDN